LIVAGDTHRWFWEEQNDLGVYQANAELVKTIAEINPVVPTPFNIGVATVQQGEGTGQQQPVGPTS